MHMTTFIRTSLGKITMYRLMLYYLSTLLIVATVLSAYGYLPYDPVRIVISTIYLLVLCHVFNWFFATLFHVKRNTESQYISALILASIIGPLSISFGGVLMFVAALVAMASKYLLVRQKKHFFNPAATGALFVALLFGVGSSWWVGNLYLFPVIVIGAILVLTKIDRLAMSGIFLVTFGLAEVALLSMTHIPFAVGVRSILTIQTIAPLLFFASVMLPEPMTSPRGRRMQYYYGAGVAVLYVAYGSFNGIAPYGLELALLSGNILSRIAIKDPRTFLTLKKKETVARDTMSFWFESSQRIEHVAGQFMEWQISHADPDNRGIRRYFTICSSPTEKQVMFTTKFSTPSSTFKTALRALHEGEVIESTGVAGAFILPKDPTVPCVFIAGGIGVTPFRSMIKYLLDKKISRPITLFYSARTAEDIAFKGLFQEAIDRGWLKVVYTVTEAAPYGWLGKMGPITADMIKEEASAYRESMVYISGPQPMVLAFEQMVSNMDVPTEQIKTDYFPGYSDTH